MYTLTLHLEKNNHAKFNVMDAIHKICVVCLLPEYNVFITHPMRLWRQAIFFKGEW